MVSFTSGLLMARETLMFARLSKSRSKFFQPSKTPNILAKYFLILQPVLSVRNSSNSSSYRVGNSTCWWSESSSTGAFFMPATNMVLGMLISCAGPSPKKLALPLESMSGSKSSMNFFTHSL